MELLRSPDDKVARGVLLNSYGWTLLQHGEPEPAAPLVREALTLIRLAGLPHLLNPALHTAGAIALARKRFPEAVEVFRESLEAGSEHPADQFYDLEGLALGLVGAGSDDERAVSLLTAASVVRTRYDFQAEPYWQDLLDEALATCRVRITAGRWRAAESAGERMSLAQAVSYALTTSRAAEEDGVVSARERHVATLVAEGLANQQIGQRLGISPHTVARHVTHARTKLGLRSRAQLAVWAGRRDGPRSGNSDDTVAAARNSGRAGAIHLIPSICGCSGHDHALNRRPCTANGPEPISSGPFAFW